MSLVLYHVVQNVDSTRHEGRVGLKPFSVRVLGAGDLQCSCLFTS